MATFSTPRGTQDILPADWPYWCFVMEHAQKVADIFGYRRIETPTFGETELFARTTGEGTDIVEKEMYSFTDQGGESLTLRPEGTAPVMRAYLQHGMSRLPQPVKLFYLERMFRYERPQRGRFREHHQFGCEAIGVEDAYLDVEVIALLVELYRRLGLSNLSLQINSIGDSQCRPAYVRDLTAYLRGREDHLAERDRERLARNPLRVLDTKETQSLPIVESAPSILDYLCADCRAHWDKLRHGLHLVGIEYAVNPRLVRGLDYYTRTVFEFYEPDVGGQAAVNGGGRYDGLAEALGGPPTPGIGFGLGIERVVLLLKGRGAEVPAPAGPRVYVAHVGAGTEEAALQQTAELHRAGVPAIMSFGDRSLKAQMKQANNTGARYAAIIGEDELSAGEVTVRSLAGHDQRTVPAGSVAQDLGTDAAQP